MTTFDYVLFVVCVCLFFYQVSLIFRCRRTAVVYGKGANRMVVSIFVLVLLAIVAWRMEDMAHRWPMLVAISAVCAAFLLSKTAISREGVFYSGRFMRLDLAEYYTIDNPKGETPVLRVSRTTKEAIVQLRQEDLPQVMQILQDNKVPTREEYVKKVDQRIQQQQSRKKKKK